MKLNKCLLTLVTACVCGSILAMPPNPEMPAKVIAVDQNGTWHETQLVVCDLAADNTFTFQLDGQTVKAKYDPSTGTATIVQAPIWVVACVIIVIIIVVWVGGKLVAKICRACRNVVDGWTNKMEGTNISNNYNVGATLEGPTIVLPSAAASASVTSDPNDPLTIEGKFPFTLESSTDLYHWNLEGQMYVNLTNAMVSFVSWDALSGVWRTNVVGGPVAQTTNQAGWAITRTATYASPSTSGALIRTNAGPRQFLRINYGNILAQ